MTYQTDPRVDAPALTRMLKQIIANNRAGGWRRLKRDKDALGSTSEP